MVRGASFVLLSLLGGLGGALAQSAQCDMAALASAHATTLLTTCGYLAPILTTPSKEAVDGLDLCPCLLDLEADADKTAAATAIKALDCTLEGVEMGPKVTGCTAGTAAPTTTTLAPTGPTSAPSPAPTDNGETKSPTTQAPSKMPTVPQSECTQDQMGKITESGLQLFSVFSTVKVCDEVLGIVMKLVNPDQKVAAVAQIKAYDICPCLNAAPSTAQAKLDSVVNALPDCAVSGLDLKGFFGTVCEAPTVVNPPTKDGDTSSAMTPTAADANASPADDASSTAASPTAASDSTSSGAPALAAGLALALAPLALLCR